MNIMAREKLENGNLNSNGFIGILGIGSIICMFCVVFLGLKLKWFRAQLKFGDSHINKKHEQSVQGLGYKLKSNPDDFQSYKLISEFSSITTPQYSTNQNFGIKSSHPNQITKSESIPNINTASSSNSIKKPSGLMSKSKSSANLTQETNQIEPKPKKSPKHATTNKSTTSKTKVEATTIIEPLIAPIGRKPTKQKVENGTDQTTNSPKLKEVKPPKIQERKTNSVEKDVTLNIDQDRVLKSESTLQIRNPLGTDRSNTRPTKFDEDNWDINVVAENVKESKTLDLETESGNYFPPNVTSMYSSQAASIFFGEAPTQPRAPARNLVTYDSDNESAGSQTSA